MAIILLVLFLYQIVHAASISFTQHYVYNEGVYYRARAVYASDLDDDGDVDVIVGDSYDDDLLWYRNNGSESFSEITIDSTFTRAAQLEVIDFDGDGDKDIVGGDNTNYAVFWWENNGSESFTEHTVSNYGSDFYIIDMDDDGDYDVVTPDWSSGVRWARNDGSMNFTDIAVDASATLALTACAGDLTGDGNIDFVANRSNTSLLLFTNDGSENFSSSTIDGSNSYNTISCADLDGDGDLDITSGNAAPGSLYWYDNNGSGTFTKKTLASGSFRSRDLMVVDLDMDGDNDLVIADNTDSAIYWFDNDGSESFTQRTVDSYYFGVSSVTVADIDSDGDLDVAAGSHENGQDVMWFEAALDSVPPIVNTLSPVNGATGVSRTANMVITFNENVDAEAGASNDIVIKKASDHSTIETIDAQDVKVTGSGTATITINPDATLDELTQYYVQIGADAFDDASGNSYVGIADSSTWSFTVGDFTNPIVASLSPVDDASNIAVDENLVIEFSENVNQETGNVVIKKTADNSTVETIAINSGQVTGDGTTTITINPSVTLNENTGYYVQIASTAIDDVYGNSYSGIIDTTSWSFTTGDFTNPYQTGLSPSDDATGVSLTANLVITFNEAVDAEAGADNDIVIKKKSDHSTIETIDAQDAKVTGSGTPTITINPDATLVSLTEYYVQVGTDAFDDASGRSFGGIIDEIAWTFSTGDFVNPSLSGLSPSDGALNVSTTDNLVITFDEAVYAQSGNISLYRSGGTLIEAFDVTADISGSGTTTITIDPTSSLSRGTTYYVQIDATAFDDASSNSFAGIADETTWNFKTVASSSSYYPSTPAPSSPSSDQSSDDEDEDADTDTLTDNNEGENNVTSDQEQSSDHISESTDTNSAYMPSDQTGRSPFNGVSEKITPALKPGDLIRGEHYDTVYVITDDLRRRPFWDAQSFESWGHDWDGVTWVTDATLPCFPLDAPILPKPGTVLVKIQSNPRVYSIDNNDTLRWIPNEQVAEILYGSDWADYIIDIEPTIFGRFQMGVDLSQGDAIDRTQLRKRYEISIESE